MTKLNIKSGNISFCGGIFHVLDSFRRLSLDKLIDSTLGVRGKNGKAFAYSEIFEPMFMGYLSGATCLEDLNTINQHIRLKPGENPPSPDTVGRALKDLATDNVAYQSEASGKIYEFNTAEKLNELLLLETKKLGLIKAGESITLDFDHQFIPAEKYDAKYSYKKECGYFPGVASCGGVILGVENRDANANVRFCQDETLKRIFERVKSVLGVSIGRFRADCGSYSKDIISTVDKYCEKFYIRASKCQNLIEEFYACQDWTEAEINYEKCGLTSMTVNNLIENKEFRLVVQRTEKDKAEGIFGKTYVFRCILTNDMDSSELEIVKFYNQRGASERNFDVMNNDFGWAKLPFSFMNENSVFMLVTAMIKNFYAYLVAKVSKSAKVLRPESRLKAFILHFISVPAKWTRTARQNVLNLYTNKPYYKEIFQRE